MRLSCALVVASCLILDSTALAQPPASTGEPSNWLAAVSSETQTQPVAEAPEPAAKSTLWGEKPCEVKFKVYAWVSGIDGDVGVANRTSTVNVDYCDVLEALDKVECMAPFNLETRVDRWGFIVDLFYVRLEDKVQRQFVSADITAQQTILELAGFYRVGTWPACPNDKSSVSLDILGGARYNRIEGAVGLQVLERAVQLDRTEQWWDPFFGPRITWRPTERLSLFGRGDVGGFGIEGCSHFVWQIVAGAEYDFTDNVFAELGYRLLDTDFETGSGRDHFSYDILMQGPYLALGVKF